MLSLSSIKAAAPVVVSCFLLAGGALSQPVFFDRVGETFFTTFQNEASGVDIAPNESHLVGVSDDGKIFFLNLNDYDSGHCFVDLSGNSVVAGRDDFEGVAIDTATWTAGAMHAYVVHEGGDDDEPILFKIDYTYDNAGTCAVTSVVEVDGLRDAIPCLETSNGIESLGLKTESSGPGNPAVFFVGIQDTGKVYEITSEGSSNGAQFCYDAGLVLPDVSASNFDGTYLWSLIAAESALTVVDPTRDCTLRTYDLPFPTEDKEGLVMDFQNDVMYIAVDGQADPSSVAVYNFTYPLDIDPSDYCCGDGICDGFETCSNCPRDCDSITKGNPNNKYCCLGPSNTCTGNGCSSSPCVGDGLGAEPCSGFTVCGAAPTCNPKGESCSVDEDCCNNKCKGGNNKTCK